MGYTPTDWKARQGSGLNRFKKTDLDAQHILLENAPTELTEPGTQFTAERMNNIERGIVNTSIAHPAILTSQGRNLETVLGTTGIPDTIAALFERCNNINNELGNPKFDDLQVGDYIDGMDLSAIPATTGGTGGANWEASDFDNRIIIAGFNTFLSYENKLNHVVLTFGGKIFKARYSCGTTGTYENTSYAISPIRQFLDGMDGHGEVSYFPDVPTAAVYNAITEQIGGYKLLYPIRLARDGRDGDPFSVFLPSIFEFSGRTVVPLSYVNSMVMGNVLPLYASSPAYRIKRQIGNQTPQLLCDTVAYKPISTVINGMSLYISQYDELIFMEKTNPIACGICPIFVVG